MKKNLLVTVALVGTIGAIQAAQALPTATVDGVTFPVGIVPGGDSISSSLLAENLITKTGQVNTGVGIVTTIDTSSLIQTWGNGQNGVELAYVFTGYVATSIVAPGLTTPGTLDFSGGTLTFYTLPVGTQITGLGSVAADVAAVTSGALWLSEKGVAEDAKGDTLIATIPAGTTLASFVGAQGEGFVDVVGGPAALNLATGTFANAADLVGGAFGKTPGFSDNTFTADFSTSSSLGSDFQLTGSGTFKANAIPEPLSMSLLGIGLVGIGVSRRRRR